MKAQLQNLSDILLIACLNVKEHCLRPNGCVMSAYIFTSLSLKTFCSTTDMTTLPRRLRGEKVEASACNFFPGTEMLLEGIKGDFLF